MAPEVHPRNGACHARNQQAEGHRLGKPTAANGFASEVEIIRRRGGNPRDVLEQIAAWREKVKEKGLTLSSDAATDKQAADPAPANGEQDAD